MNFSDEYCAKGKIKYSPNGELLAFPKEKKVCILDIQSLSIILEFGPFKESISDFEWSLNNKLMFFAFKNSSQIQIKALHDSNYNALIDEVK